MKTTPDLAVLLLAPTDLVRLAQCMAIDAEAFPYPSIPMGLQAAPLIWIAQTKTSSRAVGFVAATRRGGTLYVHGFAVTAPSRRHGVGRALLEACVAGASASGVSAVVLHVGTGNPAITLYESMGFEIRREVRDFYRPGVYAARAAYEMLLRL